MAYQFEAPEKSTPCNVEPDMFFPTSIDTNGEEVDDYTTSEAQEAAEACRHGCWFFYRCKQISRKEEYGIWAGTTPKDRGFNV